MQASDGRFDFVPVAAAPAGVREYLSEHGLRGPVYVDPAEDSRRAWGFEATPQTVVVGMDGTVVRNWRGAYRGQLLSEVSAVLGVRLPGLDM